MFKKVTSLFLAIILCFLCGIPVFGVDEPEIRKNENVKYHTDVLDATDMTEEEVEAAFKAQIEEAEASVLAAHGNLGYTKTVYGTVTTKDAVGYPGNQPEEGVGFGPAGGSFNITRSGGPTVNVSFSANLSDYFTVSIGVDLGNVVDYQSAYGCNIPGSPSGTRVYYKVIEIRNVTIRPYVVYWRQSNLDSWQVAEATEKVTINDTFFELEKVKTVYL